MNEPDWHDAYSGRRYVDHDAKPLPLFVPLSEADLMSMRSFWRGLVIGAVLAAGVLALVVMP
jgi:hypothetical protein